MINVVLAVEKYLSAKTHILICTHTYIYIIIYYIFTLGVVGGICKFQKIFLTWDYVRTSNIPVISPLRLRSSTCGVHLLGSVEVCFDSTFPHFRVKMKGAYKQRRERMQELMTKEFTKIGFPSMRPRQKQWDDGLMG